MRPIRRLRFVAVTLMEMLVVAGLMSLVSAFTMVLYTTAMADFEHANSQSSMNRYARQVVSRVKGIVSTATARRPSVIADAMYWPDLGDTLNEHTYVDFLSTSNFIRMSASECAYAFDNGSPTPGYTPLFRYRVGWTGVALGTVPANSVYLERLELDPVVSTPLVGAFRQVLSPNVGRCTFRRTLAGALQVRVQVYAYDPVTGRGIEGQTMRTMSKRARRDATSTASREDVKSFELVTAIPLPTLSIK